MKKAIEQFFIGLITNHDRHSGSGNYQLLSAKDHFYCLQVAEITFNLWYRLSEEVYQRDYQPLTESFKPHVERLIEALARHCQCEPDHTQLPEEGDEFYVSVIL